MARRILKAQLSGSSIKPPKIIFISFRNGESHSPHILDLREKLNPPPAPAWQPSPLEKMLAEPVAHFKKTIAPAPEKKFKPRRDWSEYLPEWHWSHFSFPCFAWPRFRLPHFKPPRLRRPRFHLPRILLKQKTLKRVNFVPFSLRRAALAFAAVALFFVLPLKAFSAYYVLKDTERQMVDAGTAAFEHLKNSKAALEGWDIVMATRELQAALDLFSQAQGELNQMNPVWRSFLSMTPVMGEKFRNGEHLMMAGNNLTLAALPILPLLSDAGDSQIIGNRLVAFSKILGQVMPRLESTVKHLMAVGHQALGESAEEFVKIREAVGSLNDIFKRVQTLLSTLSPMFGLDGAKTYLVIFQNNNELRPTGGFVGSFAEIKIKNGEIAKIYFPGGGSYDLQGALKVALTPPTPLQLLVSKWEFQDANWFPDLPTSAKKLIWFYEKSGGPTVDGLLALDTQVILDLLKIIGPIELPAYGKTITADNFIYEIQKQVEIDYDKKQNKPKQILADMAPLLLERLAKDKNNFLSVLLTLNRALNEKHLQLYSADMAAEEAIVAQGWGGEIKDNPAGDYLAVINANIAGGKTDGVIKQTVEHNSKIQEDGAVIDTVRVTRQHNGVAGDLFTDLQNVSYIRFYVPEGSELLLTSGFGWPDEKLFKVPEVPYQPDADLKQIEANQKIDSRDGTVITTEFGKTVFGNWVMTKPGQKSTVTVVYRLPSKVWRSAPSSWTSLFDFGGVKLFGAPKKSATYSLLVQKQAGRGSDELRQSVTWPAGWRLLWNAPQAAPPDERGNQLVLDTDLTEDRFLGAVWESSYGN